jgi:NADPH:quinone reductase-like Zn-dependent oxidoreductase
MAASPRQRPLEHAGGGARQASPAGPGEILVRLEACGLSRVDHALSTGICPMDAAGTVIAAGDRVTRFTVGDEVFGHFPAASWAWAQVPCARIAAEGPHVERRPEGLDPLAAVALAEAGLTAKTIIRAAGLAPGQTVLVVGATCRAGTVLVPLLTEAGARVIAGATPDDEAYVRSLGAAATIGHAVGDPVADGPACDLEVDLLIDLVSFDEPYFITAGALHGTIVTATAGADEPGIPRIEISAEPGDLAALAQHALDRRQPVEIAHVYRLAKADQLQSATRDPARAASTRPGGQ